MHTETWNYFPLSLIGDKRPPFLLHRFVSVDLTVLCRPVQSAKHSFVRSTDQAIIDQAIQLHLCALHNCNIGRPWEKTTGCVIRCCKPLLCCTQPTCTAGWLSPRPVCFGPTSAHRHCIAASHRIASSPSCLSVLMLVYLSADLPNNSLLVAPTSSSLSIVPHQSETCT